MAAPAYTWEFNCDLFGGNRVPVVVTLEATAIETVVGTALSMDGSGRVALSTDGNGSKFIGLAAEKTAAVLVAGDPLKVALAFPGAVYKGTAAADASALTGFISKLYDFDSDGRLDGTDVTGGGMCIYRTEDAGLTVYCLCTLGPIIG